MNRLRTLPDYPRQLWVLFAGILVSATGQAFVWPFLTIHIREQLGLPLSEITPLFTVQSIAGVAATTLISALMDQIGRKRLMVAGPVGGVLVLLAMSRADSLALWAALLAGYAVSASAIMVGANAMVADLIAPEQRSGAYALMRMGNNLGIAVGPAIGGFLAATSYTLSFYIAASVQAVIAVFVLLLVRETLPVFSPAAAEPGAKPPRREIGYGHLLRDRPFLAVFGVYLLIVIAASMVFVLLAVYLKENFGIQENQYGFILGTNAAMVVLFQYGVTRLTERRRPLYVLSVGALFYAAAMLLFALGGGFWAFWLGIVVMTCGELLIEPTVAAVIAFLAPPAMRARYLGFYTLSFRIGAGVGPVLGGFLNDSIAPVAIWYGGMAFALAAGLGFLAMTRVWHFAAEKPPADGSPASQPRRRFKPKPGQSGD